MFKKNLKVKKYEHGKIDIEHTTLNFIKSHVNKEE